jgi:hypothetical protein
MNMIKESIGKHMTRIPGIQSTLTLISEWLSIGWSLIVLSKYWCPLCYGY